MSVMTVMEDVLKYALTQSAVIIVHVTLDTLLMLIIMLVMVRILFITITGNIPIDIDECSAGTDDCEHTCFNTNGSYVCDCNVGYVLDTDGSDCIG